MLIEVKNESLNTYRVFDTDKAKQSWPLYVRPSRDRPDGTLYLSSRGTWYTDVELAGPRSYTRKWVILTKETLPGLFRHLHEDDVPEVIGAAKILVE